MKKYLIILIAALLIAGIVALYVFVDIDALRVTIEKAGTWTWIVFLLVQIMGSFVFCLVPGISVVFITLGIALFGPINAFFICSLGLVSDCTLLFLFGHFAGEKLVAKFVGEDKLKKAQDLLDVKAEIYLPIMLLLPGFPDKLLCILSGITKMKFWYFALVAVIAQPIGVASLCFVGSGIIDWGSLSWYHWVALVGLAIGGATILFLLARKLERHIKQKRKSE